MDSEIIESFDIPSEGRHQAVIAEVLHAGFEKSQFPPYKLRAMMDIVFVIEDQRNEEGDPMRVTRRITNSISRTTHLGRLLVAAGIPVDFKGKKFSRVDDALLGKKLQITIQHSRRGHATFPDIVAFTGLTARRMTSLVTDAEGL